MRLRKRVPKVAGVGPHREVPVEVTRARMAPHLRRIGITRVADITGLDRIGIPVYNAIVPRSYDLISVYNGKGTTAADARTSAVMEAYERYAAGLPRRPAAIGAYEELARRRAMDPRSFNLELYRNYRLDMPISWVRGHDLMNEESVLVPMFLAGYHMYFHETPCYPIATTNGIASGNSYEEAVCHALCEVIERDDWTIADLVSNRLSRVLVNGALGPVESPAVAAWFRDLHPNVELASLPPRAQALVEKFDAAGLCLELKNITSATGVPSILAVVAEDVAPTFSHSHYGLGTHPDAEVAAVRAVTEVAQSRVVDIQSLREDITLPDEKVDKWFYHVQRSATVNRQSWYFTRSATRVRLDDVPSHPSDDIVADIRLMLERLRRRGMTRAIVVDLSAPGIPAKVVRVIVPGVESWAIDRSELGPRAAAAWNEALTTLRGARAAALATTA